MGATVSTEADNCLICLCFGHDSATFNDDDCLSECDGDDVATALPYSKRTRSTTPTRGVSTRDQQNDGNVAGAGSRVQRESTAMRVVRRSSSSTLTGEPQYHHEEKSREVRRDGSLQERTHWMEKMVSQRRFRSQLPLLLICRDSASCRPFGHQLLLYADDSFTLLATNVLHRAQRVHGRYFVSADRRVMPISSCLLLSG